MGYGRPTIDQYMPVLWLIWRWCNVRTMANRSAWRARRGRSWEIRRPATFVAIGLKGPRTFSGASGFVSQSSMWLGAPQLKIRITDFALPLTLRLRDDSAQSQSFQ